MAQERRIVFMGTSGFARRILSGLLKGGENVVAVYAQPDRPAGRGMALMPPPTKELALEAGLPVFQPHNFRDAGAVADLAALRPDFLVVAAYGLILPQAVLDIPAIAPLNVHASLLPALRGAAPIQRAIMQNWQPDAVTGVSLMRIVRELDAGPVYATSQVAIAHLNAAQLTDSLAQAAVPLLLECLPIIASGQLEPVPQNDSQATYAPKLDKACGHIDWNRPVLEVDAHIRGVTPWPGAQTTFALGAKSIPVMILSGQPGQAAHEPPGSISLNRKKLRIACADAWYEVESLKPQGRKAMPGASFANGLRLEDGIRGKAE